MVNTNKLFDDDDEDYDEDDDNDDDDDDDAWDSRRVDDDQYS